jgi:hypothetical protein
MTGDLFSKILVEFDERSSEKRAMIVDNAGSHTIPTAAEKLVSTAIVALPPNTTALIQPNDQGIISAFKALYRKHMLRRIHSRMEGKIAEFELLNPLTPIPRNLAVEVAVIYRYELDSDFTLRLQKNLHFLTRCNVLIWHQNTCSLIHQS